MYDPCGKSGIKGHLYVIFTGLLRPRLLYGAKVSCSPVRKIRDKHVEKEDCIYKVTISTRVKHIMSYRMSALSPTLPRTLRLYSRVVACEIRKIEVDCIDFSRPSPVSKFGRGIH